MSPVDYHNMKNLFSIVRLSILVIIIFLLPLFFLPITQEFYAIAKLYFLILTCLLLLAISLTEFLVTKKLAWKRNSLDLPIIIFLITIVIAVIISSPNKIQAILNPSFGPLLILALIIFYFYLSRESLALQFTPYLLQVSSIVLAVIAIVFFFQPFKNVNLSVAWQFLKSPSFSPIGTQIDLAIFLGFSIIYSLFKVFKPEDDNKTGQKEKLVNFVILNLNFFALCFTIYSLIKPVSATSVTLPPFNISWYAAVEILKNPLTALFGVGVDNFSAIFTKVKDASYNSTNLWQVNSFILSRSAILHILTETGVFGLIGFGLIIWTIIKKLLSVNQKSLNPLILNTLYLILVLIFFPPSLIIFFLFFILISQITSTDKNEQEQEVDLTKILPVYLVIIIASIIFICTASYFAVRTYSAEFYFKVAQKGLSNNDAKMLYDNEKRAIILNPFIERFRSSFSQANLLIADSIANKNKEKITEADRQSITQAIQTAIAEAKAVVALNPQKAVNWENLAVIYRNIVNVAQGADAWAISAYQRAILLDPQNPSYRLNLGGIYYSLNNFDDASKLFEQAIALKQNWPNAYYNLAWASFKKQDYQRAVNAMQYVLNLVNPQTAKVDYEKAQKDLEEFKKMLSRSEETSQSKDQKKPELALPSIAPTGFEPKIKLPKDASPEAK